MRTNPKIEHIIVLMMENRSFDHILGYMAQENPKIDGIVGNDYTNLDSSGEPYHGFFFKVLKGQGPAAPLGELNFVVEGVMIGGFALVAAPSEYEVTGVRAFIVSHDGAVYEKDFGPKTLDEFKNMERFNPDKSWRITPD